MREGSKFLQLDPPKDIYEAINSLLIFYKNVPSVTNYPVYLGNIDELLEPFMDDVYSGKNMDRPDMQRMLELVKRKSFWMHPLRM